MTESKISGFFKNGKSKRFLLECFTPIGAGRAELKRFKFASLAKLFIVCPVMFLSTFISLLKIKHNAYDSGTFSVLFKTWSIMVVLYAFINIIIYIQDLKNSRTILALSYLCLFIEIATNQIMMYGSGTMTSSAVLFIVTVFALYRVFIDYFTSLAALLLGVGLFVFFSILEFNALIPLSPLASMPVQHTAFIDFQTMSTIVNGIVVGLFFTFFSINYGMNQSLKLHRYITNHVLQRYLPPSMVELAAKGELSLDTPPERNIVTVMFIDIVGFTSMSEKLGAEAVGDLLNRYLSVMVDIAYKYEATIDKFIGDGIMIVFGAPMTLSAEEQARRSVDLALEMLEVSPSIVQEHPMQLRIGINTGEVVTGNFGTPSRSDYTVIGPAVNIAARLEAQSKPGKVLVSSTTADFLDLHYIRESAGFLNLKGIKGAIEGFYITGKSE